MSLNNTRENRRSWIILAAIMVAGLALRIYHLDTYSIFFDEKSTLVVSQGIVLEGANQKEVFSKREFSTAEFWKTPPLINHPTVLRSFTYNETFLPKTFTPAEFWAPKSLADYYEAMTRSDIGNSPFYYLLLHIWMDIFGLSDFSIRFFSLIFSVLIIGLTFLFGKRFFSTNTGLIASAIVAVEPFFIAYSHQARNYSLTFFLTLLATYFFLQIIENKASRQKMLWLYVGYSLAAGLSLLSHFLTISVLAAHALYALFFLRTIKGWIRMAVAAAFALSGVTWWLLFGGGQYTLYSLNHQADLYRRSAETMPYNNPFGVILPATVENVFNKSLPIFSDLIIFTNGLTDALAGRKNTIIAIVVAVLLIVWYHIKDKLRTPAWLTDRLPFLLVAVSIALYTYHRIQFAIFSISLFALSFIPEMHLKADSQQRKRLWLLYIMALFPTAFLIIMAFRGGHTYGLTQRYSGFSFPFMILILSLLLQYFSSFQRGYQVLIYGFLAVQLCFVFVRLGEFYEDRSPKYGYFANPRKPNPYHAAARKIEAIYQKGDTVLYPASPIHITSEMDRTFLPYSIQDAQLTNLYFPKNAQYVQAMDPGQTEHILLKKGDGSPSIVIMKLKGLRYGLE